MVDDRDAFFMRKALRLAERGRGRTSPNPMVGALVVDGDGVVVGRGAHEYAGGPHAEIVALADAGERARGATLYCTLEPCSHRGRTGPCAPRVAEAGIARVVVATEDPNPLVSGSGHALLRSRGIQVMEGVLAEMAARLNAPFFTVMTERRPFVTMKVATSLDGRIAAERGLRSPITGPEANRHVHRQRAEVDAVAIGSGTLLTDNPLLTARVAYRTRPLTRVVFDRRLRASPDSHLFSTLEAGPIIIASTPEALDSRPDAAASLRRAGARIECCEAATSPRSVLEMLARDGVTSLIVEGGTLLHQSFWDAGLVDRVQMYVASCALGDRAVDWIAAPIVSSARITERSAFPLGDDVLIEAYVHRAH